jgi:hypothetical protein
VRYFGRRLGVRHDMHTAEAGSQAALQLRN